ncbi:Sulfotransferase domain [Arabidopsis thaliana x Arabidopsis arenosa]|uniref:Sulfotransferase n=1 Tax=Arabidopsis thaliana x Arabidopsis arenosa TaxID=1240361 RepID=A0A8T2C7V9_9BRAS|nr:Sulfotransferase domain [Arabidopsis thaliana x Arabidopsis arenosa]
MGEIEIPRNLKDETEHLSEEIKSLISSLPSDIDCSGVKLFKYQGCWYDKDILQAILNFNKNFQPQETDIIVASFPKSGTTWLKALTFALAQRSKHTSDNHPLLTHNPHELVPYLELDLYLKSSKPDLTKLPSSSPRLFSTHMSFDALKVPLKESPCKIVYVCRNVKDVLVSLWCFENSNSIIGLDGSGESNVSLEALFESFCSGVSLCGPLWENVLSYWRGSLEDPKQVLFLRYEELKTEPREQIKKLAQFLDCPFTKEEEDNGGVDKILELCSLRNLSSLEINKTGKLSEGVSFKSFFRKGEVGDWKSYMTPEMENKIDMIVEEKLQVPFLELDLYLKTSKPDLTKFLSSSLSPRLFSTHMSFDALKAPLKESSCKIVYVCRNVKDVLVSLWHFLNANKGVEWEDFSQNEKIIRVEDYSFEAMFESFCNGVTLYGPFEDHALSYWRGCSLENPKHVLFMMYEEFKADPLTQIKRLVLDCPFTKEEEDSGSVDKILELCSLSNLSSLEINKTGTLDGVDFKTYFRKGQVGDWKSYMTPEMVNKIDIIIEEKLKGSGLKF